MNRTSALLCLADHKEGSWYQHYLFDIEDIVGQCLCSELTAYTRIVKYVLTNLFVGKMPQPIRNGVCQGTDGSSEGSSLAFSSPLSIKKQQQQPSRQTKPYCSPKEFALLKLSLKKGYLCLKMLGVRCHLGQARISHNSVERAWSGLLLHNLSGAAGPKVTHGVLRRFRR